MAIESSWRFVQLTFSLGLLDSTRNGTWCCAQSRSRATMKRTFNYTGRRKISRADAGFTIHQRERAWAFDAELRLAAYRFAHNAEVWVEAHRQNLWMQWSWGTISALRVPPDRR